MLDIHTHLYFPQYDTDRSDVLSRAFSSKITTMISVSTEPDDHAQALEIASLDDRIFASVGLHPHTLNDHFEDESWKNTALLELAYLIHANKKIIAIGECGLDYYSHTIDLITDAQKKWQKSGFISQLQLAKKYELPVIIHCRDAYEDLFAILSEATKDQGQHQQQFVIHCYMGDVEVTQQFLTLPHVYFSFTGNITYPVKKIFEGTKNDPAEVVRCIPLERMFIETDCPFLAPVPHRGKRNEPSFVVEVAKKIAEIKQVDQRLFEDILEQSAKKVFGI